MVLKTRDQSIKNLNLVLKFFVSLVFRIRVEKDPIIILASRRGGSTFISKELSLTTGIAVLDHPFGKVNNLWFQRRKLYPEGKSQLFRINGISQFRCVNSIVNGSDLSSLRWRGLGSLWSVNQVVLKVTEAKWLLNYFSSQTNHPILWYLRSPVDQVVSIMSFGWAPSLGVKDLEELSYWYDDRIIELARETFESGDLIAIHALCWFLENEWLESQPGILRVSHEEIMEKPELLNQIRNVYGQRGSETEIKKSEVSQFRNEEVVRIIRELFDRLGSRLYNKHLDYPLTKSNINDYYRSK